MLTIGHSTLPIATFLKILAENDVGKVVDIRTIPKSRHNPQFAQNALSQALTEESIKYQWQPSLGGLRKPDPESFLNAGWTNASFRGYADYMQTPEFSQGIDELLSRAHVGAVLLCAEALPWRCHRSLVADALVVRDVPVEHILYSANGASKRQPHQLTRFAKVDGVRLWYPNESDLFAASGS